MRARYQSPQHFDEDIYNANMSIIRRRWTDIYGLLTNCENLERVEIDASYSVPTLVIDGIHLSSVFDPVREAKLQTSPIAKGSDKVWVYGIGIGALPRQLLAEEISHLFTVVLSPAVSRQVFGFLDQTDWLSDSRLTLLSATSDQNIHFPFCVVPPELFLACESSSRLRDNIYLELQTPHIKAQHANKRLLLEEKIQIQSEFIRSDGDVTDLFNTAAGEIFVVAGAGPTLDEHFNWLSRNRKKVRIVSVDAAYKSLSKNEIFPDVVVAIDDHGSLHGLFDQCDLSKATHIPLVYFPQVTKSLLSIWPGPRKTAYTMSPLHEKIKKEIPKGNLYTSGSVIHTAVDLAVKMGAGTIIFMGADFSYPGGKSHSSEFTYSRKVDLKKRSSHWVLNGEGERVVTSTNLRGYLRDLENYIETVPEVTFYNASKKGALISGTKHLEEFHELT